MCRPSPGPEVIVVLLPVLAGLAIAGRSLCGTVVTINRGMRLPTCRGCRYDLAGLDASACCPECGSSERVWSQPERRYIFRPRSALAFVLVLLVCWFSPYIVGSVCWTLGSRIERINEPFLSSMCFLDTTGISAFTVIAGILLSCVAKSIDPKRWWVGITVGIPLAFICYAFGRWFDGYYGLHTRLTHGNRIEWLSALLTITAWFMPLMPTFVISALTRMRREG